MSLEQTMKNCEDLSGKIAHTFHNLQKELQAFGLMVRIRKELPFINDVATDGIKLELEKKNPNIMQIIYELKQGISEGYKGFSIPLSNDILNF